MMILRVLGRIWGCIGRYVIPIVLLTLLIGWSFRLKSIVENAFQDTAEARAKEAFAEAEAHDPEWANVYERLKVSDRQQAMAIAVHSAGAERRTRSTLVDLAKEMEETGALPYRARLAHLAQRPDLGDDERREAFFAGHATACEALSVGGSYVSAHRYMQLLEQAASDPEVWRLVWNDPLALVIWSQVSDLDLLQFYVDERDWLEGPMVTMEFRSPTIMRDDEPQPPTLEEFLRQIQQHREVAAKVVEQGELSLLGLGVVLTHGDLLQHCWDQFRMDPSEVAAIVLFNKSVFSDSELGVSRDTVIKKAAWLSDTMREFPNVWFAASRTPFALRLHDDAPAFANTVLDRYGSDDVAVMIYERFSEREEVVAVAAAICAFEDMTMGVLAKYQNEEFLENLKRYLLDSEIGIRVFPFIVRFQDEAFAKIEDDPAWVDRYFDESGKAREDKTWVENIPGGALYVVAKNWADGHPCEWSEIGWAAVDAADIALTVASMGSSKVITTSASVAAKGARRAAPASARGARKEAARQWRKALPVPPRTARTASRFPRLARSAEMSMDAGRVIWGPVRLAGRATARVSHEAGAMLQNWKRVPPATKRQVYRGLLAVGLFITLTERTIPNFEEIGRGIGTLAGDAIAGFTKMVWQALLGSFEAIVTANSGPPWALFASGVLWVALFGTAIWTITRAFRPRGIVVRS